MAAAAVLYDVVAEEFVLADMIANTAIVVGAWGFARITRISTDTRVEAEISRDRFAREAVLAERTRIARDLHDSVAHALTLMTLQAGGARERASEPVVVDALHSIEEGGREALADMHRFLKLLGDPADGSAEVPGLRDLEDMVARVRSAGLDVRLSTEGDLESVPASVASTTYRIVQEGLTNSIRHSGARTAFVSVTRAGDEVLVEVTDNGAVSHVERASQPGSGRGLASLRDRVDLFGGRISAGERPGEGWQVLASIPFATAGPT